MLLEFRIADVPFRGLEERGQVPPLLQSLTRLQIGESPSSAKASGAQEPARCAPEISRLGFPTHLEEKEPGAAAEAKNVPDVDPTVGAGWDAGFVKKGAVSASQVVEVEAGPVAVRRPVGAAPVLQHGVEPGHGRVLQAHVAARQPPEKAATGPFQAAGAKDRSCRPSGSRGCRGP